LSGRLATSQARGQKQNARSMHDLLALDPLNHVLTIIH